MTIKISTLSNGMRVATDTMKHAHTVSIQVCVDIGSRYETPENNGISHFLEHMAFKGTKRRSAQDIAKAFDAIGGHFNAYTSREHTVYYAKVLNENLNVAVDILGDILQHSVFDPEELARERNVVLQEIAQNNDTPDDVVFDFYQEASYPDQPLGRSILGTEDIVSNFSREDLTEYVNTYYRGSRMILVAAGNIEHDAMVKLAESTFRDLKKDTPSEFIPATYKGGEHRKEKDLEQVHLILGFEGISYKNPEIYTIQMLSIILGGSISSRLFQEVREKHGLAYSVYSFSSGYQDNGTFGVYAGTGKEHLHELVPIVCDELLKMTHTITEEEVMLAKTQVKASILMAQESTYARADELGRHLLCFGRHISMEEVLGKVEAVDIAQLHKMMKYVLTQSSPTLSAIGNLGALESYDSITKRLEIA